MFTSTTKRTMLWLKFSKWTTESRLDVSLVQSFTTWTRVARYSFHSWVKSFSFATLIRNSLFWVESNSRADCISLIEQTQFTHCTFLLRWSTTSQSSFLVNWKLNQKFLRSLKTELPNATILSICLKKRTDWHRTTITNSIWPWLWATLEMVHFCLI